MKDISKKATIFISYAREDQVYALKVFSYLKSRGLNVWIDVECILPGQDWVHEINNAIDSSDYFVALISTRSLYKNGKVQKELTRALNKAEEYPKSAIYFILVLLEKCSIDDERLLQYHWLELYSGWKRGIQRIIDAIDFEEGRKYILRDFNHRNYLRKELIQPITSFSEQTNLFLSAFVRVWFLTGILGMVFIWEISFNTEHEIKSPNQTYTALIGKRFFNPWIIIKKNEDGRKVFDEVIGYLIDCQWEADESKFDITYLDNGKIRINHYNLNTKIVGNSTVINNYSWLQSKQKSSENN